MVALRDFRRALAWAGAQPGVASRWRLALALSAYQGRFVARNALLGIRTPEALERLFTVRGAEHLVGAGRGVILLGFHAGPRLSWLACCRRPSADLARGPADRPCGRGTSGRATSTDRAT